MKKTQETNRDVKKRGLLKSWLAGYHMSSGKRWNVFETLYCRDGNSSLTKNAGFFVAYEGERTGDGDLSAKENVIPLVVSLIKR